MKTTNYQAEDFNGTSERKKLTDRQTLSRGQCCNLKIQSRNQRVWVCRVGGGVSVETYNGARWVRTSGGCEA